MRFAEALRADERPSSAARAALMSAVIGLSAAGATCKGSDGSAEAPSAPPPAVVPAPAPTPTPVLDLKGIEIARVPPALRGEAVRLLQESFCYCGCARTVAACLSNREACACVECSERVANVIISELEAGANIGQVENLLVEALSESYNQPPVSFDLTDQAVLGDPNAKYTLVEFADFRCPHCRDAFGELVKFVRSHPDVRLVYYYFPLTGFGPISEQAAAAAEAARKQGKFWPMAERLYENQTALGESAFRRFAEEIGLDVARFDKDRAAPETMTAVRADKSIGTSAGVQGTPAIYVDGRPIGFPGHDAQTLELRLAMEEDRNACD